MSNILTIAVFSLFILLDGYQIGAGFEEKNYKKVGLNAAFLLIWVLMFIAATKIFTINVNNIYN